MFTLPPFGELQIDFCETLSQSLFEKSDPKLFPELMALAFWLRKRHIEELHQRFDALSLPGEKLVPRGIAFHIAPANVETLFVYSWILSLLVGNANIVRLPSRHSEATELLFSILQNILSAKNFEKIALTTQLVAYGHDEEKTAALSAQADLRLIWGSDATMQTIRQIPLKIAGKELIFADRYAFAVFRGAPSAALFFRDLFWYDQQTCASPRALFWIGERHPQFYRELELLADKKNYKLPVANRLQKELEIYRAALDLPVLERGEFGPLTILRLAHFHPACRRFGGNGLLFEIQIRDLAELAELIIQKDQTLVHAGLSEEELQHFVEQLNGRGVDRLIPVGSALQFQEVWDGYDLLVELTKRVVVKHA